MVVIGYFKCLKWYELKFWNWCWCLWNWMGSNIWLQIMVWFWQNTGRNISYSFRKLAILYLKHLYVKALNVCMMNKIDPSFFMSSSYNGSLPLWIAYIFHQNAFILMLFSRLWEASISKDGNQVVRHKRNLFKSFYFEDSCEGKTFACLC